MEILNKKSKAQNGITLIALVITIIVLLILAGVAINMAIDSDGLFGKANEAAKGWNTSIGEEEETINDLLNKLDEIAPSPMITKWNMAAGDEVYIVLYSAKEYSYDEEGNEIVTELPNNTNVTIDWGDGTVENYTNSNLLYEDSGDGYVTHTYNNANAQTIIKISGECNIIDMSEDDTKLISIEQWGYTNSIRYYFAGCRNLERIASPGKNTFRNVKDFFGMFQKTGLISIPEDLFENCPSATSFESTFWRCYNLRSVPEHLFDKTQNVTSFAETFYQCYSLQGNAIPLWERVTGDTVNYEGQPDGYACYGGCTGLENYEDIPNYWTSQYPE